MKLVRRMSLSASRRLSVSSPSAAAAAAAALPSCVAASMPNTEAEERREEAARLHLSIDEVAAARHLLYILQDANRFPELRCPESPSLHAAIFRYETCWLPLIAAHPAMELYPPLDVQWIWLCHRLDPKMYAADCMGLHERLLDMPLTKDIAKAKRLTAMMWREMYPAVPYEVDTCWSAPDGSVTKLTGMLMQAAVDLGRMWHQVSLDHYAHPRFLRNAALRYRKFLYLLKQNGGKVFLVSSPDIDLIWKAHMMFPIAYDRDIKAIIGHVISPQSLLQCDTGTGNVTDTTATMWRESFDEIFYQAGASYRGEPDVIDVRVDLRRTIGYHHTTMTPEAAAAAVADVNEARYGIAPRAAFCAIVHLKHIQALYHADKHPADFCCLQLDSVPKTEMARQTEKAPMENPYFDKIFFLAADESSEAFQVSVKRSRALAKKAKIASGRVKWEELQKRDELCVSHRLPIQKRDEERGFVHMYTSVIPPTLLGPALQFRSMGPAYTDNGKVVQWICYAAHETKAEPFSVAFGFPNSRTAPRTINISQGSKELFVIKQEGNNSASIRGERFRGTLTSTRVEKNRVRCDFHLASDGSASQPLLSIQFGRRLEYARKPCEVPELRVYTIVCHTPHTPYGVAAALVSLGSAPFIETAPWFDAGIALAVHSAANLITSILCIPASKLQGSGGGGGLDMATENRRIYDDDGVILASGAMWLTMYAASGIADAALSIGLAGAEGIMDLAGAIEGLGIGEIFSVF